MAKDLMSKVKLPESRILTLEDAAKLVGAGKIDHEGTFPMYLMSASCLIGLNDMLDATGHDYVSVSASDLVAKGKNVEVEVYSVRK